MNRNVEVIVACELCEDCIKFEIANTMPHIIDELGRGWPEFKPHCKYLGVCMNLLKMMEEKNGKKTEAEADGTARTGHILRQAGQQIP